MKFTYILPEVFDQIILKIYKNITLNLSKLYSKIAFISLRSYPYFTYKLLKIFLISFVIYTQFYSKFECIFSQNFY